MVSMPTVRWSQLSLRLRDRRLILFSLCVRADFEKPSAIQQRAILPITKGRDVIAQVSCPCSEDSVSASFTD